MNRKTDFVALRTLAVQQAPAGVFGFNSVVRSCTPARRSHDLCASSHQTEDVAAGARCGLCSCGSSSAPLSRRGNAATRRCCCDLKLFFPNFLPVKSAIFVGVLTLMPGSSFLSYEDSFKTHKSLSCQVQVRRKIPNLARLIL